VKVLIAVILCFRAVRVVAERIFSLPTYQLLTRQVLPRARTCYILVTTNCDAGPRHEKVESASEFDNVLLKFLSDQSSRVSHGVTKNSEELCGSWESGTTNNKLQKRTPSKQFHVMLNDGFSPRGRFTALVFTLSCHPPPTPLTSPSTLKS